MNADTNIIVVGANGRMGRAIIGLIDAKDDFALAGAVESAEAIKTMPAPPCPISDKLETILEKAPHGVVVDFTSPAASLANATVAAAHKRPMVIGTTGFDAAQKAQLAALAENSPLLWSANMSVGINALLAILPKLAKLLGAAYDMEIVETHHRHKKDAPSGTALMLEEALARARGWEPEKVRNSARNGIIGARPDEEIGVMALRGGDVAGIHNCYFFGTGEMIEISHVAESRDNFAQGALRAAAWLKSAPAGRLYSMFDVLGIDR